MKKISAFVLLSFLFMITTQAQPLIGGTIGHYFLQGITGQNNTLRTSGAYPNGTIDVKFIIADVNHTTAYTFGWGVYDSQYDDYSLDIDMGSLPSNAPENLVAYASYYDINGPIAGGTLSTDWAITLTPKPAWLQAPYNGQLSVTNIQSNTLEMDGYMPLSNFLSANQTVSGVTGLIGKAFSLSNQYLDFHISYNMANGSATGSQVVISGEFEPLGTTTSQVGNSITGSLTFDNDFNLILNGTAVWSPTPIVKSFDFENVSLIGNNSLGIGIGALCVNTSLKFSLSPKIKAQIYAGTSGGQWGFLNGGSNVTQFLGKVNATATAKGELKAVCGSVFGINFGVGTIARGEVSASLNIGAGKQYYSLPSPTPTNLWYGDFSIHAEGEVTGFGSKSGDYNPATWGNSSSFSFKTDDVVNTFFEANTYGGRSVTLPQAWPMGKISTRDSVLAAAWIDNHPNNFPNGSALLVAYYSPISNAFSSPIIVAQNDSGICNHSISLLPNKNIFIAWSQLNTSESQTTNMTLDNISKSQDIFIAIVDIHSNSVVYKGKLANANFTGADGEPRVHWGNGNRGMITWQAGNPGANNGSNIYASEIIDSSNGYYYIFPAGQLNTATGFNYNVTVSYGNSNTAIATWFNDPDMNSSTHNEEIYYSSWNGWGWWTTPQLRFDLASVIPGSVIKDYSLSTNGNYGIEALTYEYLGSDESTINGIALRGWNNGDLISLTTPAYYEDVTQDYKLPQVSVSKNGKASLVIQQRNLLDANSDGKLNLYLKDLNNLTSQWQEQTDQFITDTTQFVWDMSAKFGYLQDANSSDIIYVFTQEMDNAGNSHATSYAQQFGNPNLNLLLRAFKVNANLTLTEVTEPSTANITGFYQELSPYNETFELKPNYPNPFNDETTIPFHLYKGGRVLIELFNLNGQSLGEILDTELSGGDYVTKFNRRNLESGIYFYRINIENDNQTGKLVIID